jgi:citrate lyase beta subunit
MGKNKVIVRIFSQNLTNYNIPLPKNSIFRINLAWINSLEELKNLLKKHEHSEIFLDLPIGRTKPPNNKYTFDEIIHILNSAENIKYFAISNVNNSRELEKFIDKIPDHVSIVPKIESPEGISNIKEITDLLGSKKIIMLDHDDLFSNLTKKNESPEKFKDYIINLTEFCQKNNVIMLRTIGVVFSNEETRTTQYIK